MKTLIKKSILAMLLTLTLTLLTLMIFVKESSGETKKNNSTDLKQSIIVRYTEDNEPQEFDGSRYKIVLRDSKEKEVKAITRVITKRIYIRKPERQNNVTFHLGADIWGQDSVSGIGGFSYSRRILEDVRLTGTGLSNGVFMGGVGFDF